MLLYDLDLDLDYVRKVAGLEISTHVEEIMVYILVVLVLNFPIGC